MGPSTTHAGGGGNPRDLGLRRKTVGPALGEAGREDHRGADAACRQRADGVEHGGAGDREHGGIDACRQLGDRSERLPARDDRPLRIDEVDCAGEAVPLEVTQHRIAERPRLFPTLRRSPPTAP